MPRRTPWKWRRPSTRPSNRRTKSTRKSSRPSSSARRATSPSGTETKSRRRRPHNRLKKLVGSIRKGKAASDQGKLAFRRTEGGRARANAVEVNQESPKKKGP